MLYSVEVPEQFSKYLIPRGSIALDGVSLTIAETNKNQFLISIIPHTNENTIFSHYQVGSRVNLEFDMIGKYIEHLMVKKEDEKSNRPPLTVDMLKELGY